MTRVEVFADNNALRLRWWAGVEMAADVAWFVLEPVLCVVHT
jgi:hypothetical protein